SVASKPDSQEICFVPDDDYAGFIEKSGAEIPKEGNFVDENGKVLGKHKGIIHYTVGQRKGLGLAMGTPVFVKEIRADKNEVVIGSEASLHSGVVICDDVNFQSIERPEIGEKVRCRAKIRYHHKAADACIEMIDENRLKITFDDPVKAATPGQSAVFYDENDCVVGGGIIKK
ncbi:MAG: tRNA 2-thiouridine(34) synthase MnmA, partial [Lachnospiraceae bacterium]|nr:tRNA 2-thiouridine(34) synthase MnmA [Lachnospiraceae bacterium]